MLAGVVIILVNKNKNTSMPNNTNNTLALITIDKYVVIAKVIIKAISIIFFKVNPVNKQFPSLLSDIFKVYTADFVDLYLFLLYKRYSYLYHQSHLIY